MSKEKYERSELEIIKFQTEDVIMTSGFDDEYEGWNPYSGDEAVTDENLKWMNELAPDAGYTQVAEFLMDFHTPEDVGEMTFNADSDYTDYQWWLARTDDGG